MRLSPIAQLRSRSASPFKRWDVAVVETKTASELKRSGAVRDDVLIVRMRTLLIQTG